MTETRRGSNAWRRWAVCVIAMGVVLGLFLPFLVLGRRSRSMWGLASAATDLGLVNGGFAGLAVAIVRALPILVGLLCCAVALGRRVFAMVLAGLVGLISLGIGLGGFVVGGPTIGAATLSICGAGVLATSWLVPRNETATPRFALAALVGIVAVVGGTAVSVQSLSVVGSDDPAEAARAMMEALDDRDPIRALEVLAPGERAALVRSGASVFTEFRRLRVVSGTSAVRKERKARRFEVDELHSNHVVVEMISGKSPDIFRAQNITIGTRLNVVKVDQRWFISIGASVSENVRRGLNRPQVAQAMRIASAGAESPVAAVQAFLQSAGQFDIDGVLTNVDPEELEAAADYVPMLVDAYRKQADNLRADFQLVFPELELLSNTDGNTAVVRVNRWSAELTLAADQVDDSTISLDGDCLAVSVALAEPIERCGEEAPLVLGDVFGVSASPLSDEQQRWLSEPITLPGIVTVQRDGKWFVSPTRTVLGFLAEWLEGLSPEDVTGPGKTLPERLRRGLDSIADLSGAIAPTS